MIGEAQPVGERKRKVSMSSGVNAIGHIGQIQAGHVCCTSSKIYCMHLRPSVLKLTLQAPEEIEQPSPLAPRLYANSFMHDFHPWLAQHSGERPPPARLGSRPEMHSSLHTSSVVHCCCHVLNVPSFLVRYCHVKEQFVIEGGLPGMSVTVQ